MSSESKHPGGRPPKYDSPEAMQAAIDRYFDQMAEKQPTLSSLAFYLGFASRQSMYAYERKEEFSYTIKRARLRIEMIYEAQLLSNSVPTSGVIFALKNLGWSDRQQIETTISSDRKPVTLEDLKKRLDYDELNETGV